jgi:hypothetical protein
MTSRTPGTHAASASGQLEPILWFQAEPSRLERDRSEVAVFAPLMEFHEAGSDEIFTHGGWAGELPKWPFDRSEPAGLDELIGEHGAKIVLVYSAAHPMVPPIIYSLDPLPTVWEQTQAAWHVAPGGSLCLLQNVGAWQPEASITELLAKAAGWRVEYALMKAEVIDRMTTNGIVSDDALDDLIVDAAKTSTATHASGEMSNPDVP